MKKIDKMKWALYRTIAEPTPRKLEKAKWIMYGAAALSTALLFTADPPTYPKWPRYLGD